MSGQHFPEPRLDAPLVVFDFDHTLYDGDSGSHLFKWLIDRAWWRQLLALLAAPVAGPMVAWLRTRRAGISVFVWIGTVGLHRRRGRSHRGRLPALARLRQVGARGLRDHGQERCRHCRR